MVSKTSAGRKSDTKKQNNVYIERRAGATKRLEIKRLHVNIKSVDLTEENKTYRSVTLEDIKILHDIANLKAIIQTFCTTLKKLYGEMAQKLECSLGTHCLVFTGSIPVVPQIFGIERIFIPACLIKQPNDSLSRMCVLAQMRIK